MLTLNYQTLPYISSYILTFFMKNAFLVLNELIDTVMEKIISWHLPIKTASESNCSKHWSKKHRRHRIQKEWVNALFLRDMPKITLPVHIVLTRIAPRSLDEHDNLPMSFKWLADAVASNLIPGKKAGRADDSKELTWEYRQKKGSPNEYGVQIEILS